jgi:hypothetical protein
MTNAEAMLRKAGVATRFRALAYNSVRSIATHKLSGSLGAHGRLQRLGGHDRIVSRHDEGSQCRGGRKHERLPDALLQRRNLVEIPHQRSDRFWSTSIILLMLQAKNVSGYERGGIRCSCQR